MTTKFITARREYKKRFTFSYFRLVTPFLSRVQALYIKKTNASGEKLILTVKGLDLFYFFCIFLFLSRKADGLFCVEAARDRV
jgi:hypothetical protein